MLDDLPLPETFKMIAAGASPALLLKINAAIDVEVDDYMREKIHSNPIV
jgi:hypothetical protein